MLINNEYLIKIQRDEAIEFLKNSHELQLNQHYWNYTKNKVFLDKYKQNVIKNLELTNYLVQKYLKDKIWDTFSIDINNNLLIYKKYKEKTYVITSQ